MAVFETLKSVKANLLLNNGSTASGSIRTINQSLGTLGTDWDVEKAFAIANALAPILTKQVVSFDGIKTYSINSN